VRIDEAKVGDVVQVGPAYRGGNTFQGDGTEGVYTVVALLTSDCKLARGTYTEPPPAEEWDLICHPSRLTMASLLAEAA